MNKKNVFIIATVAVAVIGWFIAAHFFGPNSSRSIQKEVERLRADSIALQGDFVPKGKYSVAIDVLTDYNKLQSLGRPLRYNNTDTDSVRLFSNPQTASIANYNIAKCDSVINNVSPLWRSAMILALGTELRNVNENSIVRVNHSYEKYTGVEIYSIRYLSKEEMEKDVVKYNHSLRKLGFKSVIYGMSPESECVEYTFN